MTEEEAQSWIAFRFPDAIAGLREYARLLASASREQNLVAASTLPVLWSRHLLDSAQLVAHAPMGWLHWLDIGTGAGLPGLVIGILTGRKVTLIEPRRLRVEFLRDCVSALDLANVDILHAKVETALVTSPADIISARAVASIERLFAISRSFATPRTTFILPKGASARVEVANARRSWHGRFHVEQSIVDPASGIVVASDIRPR